MSIDGIQLAEYILYNQMSIGVAFESGCADYAEWLKKDNANEFLSFGDVVGVRGGSISKSFVNAENYMVISQNPLISGAIPQKNEEHLFDTSEGRHSHSDKTNTTLDVKAQMAENVKKNKEKLQSMLKDTKTLFENHKFDFTKFPYLMEAIENPTAENRQKLANYYNKLLVKLQKMRPVRNN